MAKPIEIIGASIVAYGKSLHAGHGGAVVADYGSMLLVLSDEEKYEHSHRNSIGEGKYFQVDSLLVKILKLADV